MLAFAGADMLKIIENMYQEQITANGYNSSVGGALLDAARGIAGIAGICWVGSKLAGQILRNEGINFIPLLRPFALIFLIAYIPQVANLIDKTFDGIAKVAQADNAAIATRVQALQKKREEAVKKKWQIIEENSDEYNKIYGDPTSVVPGVETVVKSFNIAIGKMTDDVKSALYDFTQSMLAMLGDIAYIILYLISVVYRIILRVIAPISIAIAIFDGMSNNFIEWIGKYVNYALLPCIAGIYQNIAVKINMTFLTEMVASGDISATLPGQDPFAFGLVYTGVLVIILVIYTQIPSITNMVMVVGGTSGIVQGLTAKTAAMGRTASPVAARGARAGAHGTMVAAGAAMGSVAGAAVGGARTGSVAGAAAGVVGGAIEGGKAASGMYTSVKNSFNKVGT